MIFLLGIYLVVGGFSAITNFGRWLFSSWLIGILFLPFMIIYFLIYGDEQKKKEAISLLGLIPLCFIVYFIILIIQN
jgi:hypothetical protein